MISEYVGEKRNDAHVDVLSFTHEGGGGEDSLLEILDRAEVGLSLRKLAAACLTANWMEGRLSSRYLSQKAAFGAKVF